MNDFMKMLKVKVVPLEIPPAPLAAPAPDIDLQDVIAMHAEAMAADKDATTAASHDFPFGFAGTDGNTREAVVSVCQNHRVVIEGSTSIWTSRYEGEMMASTSKTLQDELKLLKDENANLQRRISVSTSELKRMLKIVDDLENPGQSFVLRRHQFGPLDMKEK